MNRTLVVCCLLGLASAGPALARDYHDVTVSEPHPTASGTWQYTLKRSVAWACDAPTAAGRCIDHVLTVNNQSGEALDCRLRVDYQRPGGAAANSVENPVLVLPRTKSDVHRLITDEATQADLRFLDCRARTPYQRLARDPECKYTMMGKPFETYYPPEAKLKSQQGPVIVSFLLPQRQGDATEVAIAESSLVPVLDAAAMRFIRDQEFVTNCSGRRYDVLMRFKLRDEVVAQAGNRAGG